MTAEEIRRRKFALQRLCDDTEAIVRDMYGVLSDEEFLESLSQLLHDGPDVFAAGVTPRSLASLAQCTLVREALRRADLQLLEVES